MVLAPDHVYHSLGAGANIQTIEFVRGRWERSWSAKALKIDNLFVLTGEDYAVAVRRSLPWFSVELNCAVCNRNKNGRHKRKAVDVVLKFSSQDPIKT